MPLSCPPPLGLMREVGSWLSYFWALLAFSPEYSSMLPLMLLKPRS